MVTQPVFPSLADLEAIPYIDDRGELPNHLEGKLGIYAIFDADHTLQYIGYSRNMFLSLQQHLVRQPLVCHWVKAWSHDRPDRTWLEQVQTAWIAEQDTVPLGNGPDQEAWQAAIAVTPHLTPEEQTRLEAADEFDRTKLLKSAARRIEAQILEILAQRGLKTPIRFNPKLKEKGLLDLKS